MSKPGNHAAGGNVSQQMLMEIELPEPIEHLSDEIDKDIQHRLHLANRAMTAVRERVEPATWEAFWRTTMEGQAAASVANSLGKSVRSIYMASCRVRKMLLDEGRLFHERTDELSDNKQ